LVDEFKIAKFDRAGQVVSVTEYSVNYEVAQLFAKRLNEMLSTREAELGYRWEEVHEAAHIQVKLVSCPGCGQLVPVDAGVCYECRKKGFDYAERMPLWVR